MKKLILAILVGFVLLLSGCGTPPTVGQASLIQQACIQDALVRPIVTGLLTLATPAESDAVKLAEINIDAVCANPAATPAANIQAAFNAAIAKIATIEGALLARQAEK